MLPEGANLYTNYLQVSQNINNSYKDDDLNKRPTVRKHKSLGLELSNNNFHPAF